MPIALTPLIMAANAAISRSFGDRHAAPMQYRVAPPDLALRASAKTRSTSINLEAESCDPFTADCEQ